MMVLIDKMLRKQGRLRRKSASSPRRSASASPRARQPASPKKGGDVNDTVLRAPAPSQTLGTLKSGRSGCARKGGRPQRGKVQFNNKVKKGFAERVDYHLLQLSRRWAAGSIVRRFSR